MRIIVIYICVLSLRLMFYVKGCFCNWLNLFLIILGFYLGKCFRCMVVVDSLMCYVLECECGIIFYCSLILKVGFLVLVL